MKAKISKIQKPCVIGWGMVGKATSKALGIPKRDCYDIDKKMISWDYDCYILCLPSPTNYRDIPYLSMEYKIQDLSAIESWLQDIKKNSRNSIVVIRSTVLPKTTKEFSKKYRLNIVHVPEFLTEKTALKDEKKPEFLVVGGKDKSLVRVVTRLFIGKVKPNIVIETDSTTAELIKYTMNSFFALKVVFGNQIYDVAKSIRADYETVAKCLESHKWGSKNGWDVWHGGYRGFGGHCLPKDTEAFRNKFNLPLIDTMTQINNRLLDNKRK